MNAISKNDLLQAIKDNEKKNHPISLDCRHTSYVV